MPGSIHGLYLCFPSWNLHFPLSWLNFFALDRAGGRRQLPAPSHGWKLHFTPTTGTSTVSLLHSTQQQSESTKKCFGVFKSPLRTWLILFSLPKACFPHGSSRALQVAPSVFSCLSAARGRNGTLALAVPGSKLWMQPPRQPFHLQTCGTLGFSSHPKTSQGGDTPS